MFHNSELIVLWLWGKIPDSELTPHRNTQGFHLENGEMKMILGKPTPKPVALLPFWKSREPVL